MMFKSWRYAFNSVIGTSHTHCGWPCQDASECSVLYAKSGEPVLIAIVSDGAGSAECSEIGAQLACSLFVSEMTSLFENDGSVQDITCDFAKGWVQHFQNEVSVRAEAEGRTSRDFACTVLAAAVGTDRAAFFQIGDGAIVISSQEEPEEYSWIFWPQKGEYENTTIFATDVRALEQIDHDFVERRIDEIALFTDGLQRLALHFQSQTAHAPFFHPMFTPLRQSPEGFSEKLSHSLAAFLSSPQVNDRTDDDKTLVLATRRGIDDQTASSGKSHGVL
jgi:hypothetical protein